MLNRGLRLPLKRVDLTADTTGLPPSLTGAIEKDGGLWAAGDAYTFAAEVVETAKRVGAVALRLDFRDLSLLDRLPGTRYLHVRSDGRPVLDPIAKLAGLRALIVETSAVRGELDPIALPDLRWLRISLGGKGGAAVLPALQRGHQGLEWLSLREVRCRTATELCAGFPNLRVLRIGYADYLRELGDLPGVTPNLEKIALNLTQIRTLDGVAGLDRLHTLDVSGGRVRKLPVMGRVPRLRYARIELPDLESIEPLREHPALRMLALGIGREPDHSVLASLSGLVAIRRGKGFEEPVPWPDIGTMAVDDPLRIEWVTAMAE